MISKRLKLLIDYQSISVRQFEQRIGASNGLIARCISKNTDISTTWLSKIIETFKDISPDWLLTGRGEMLRSNTDEAQPSHRQVNSRETTIYKELLMERERKLEEKENQIKELNREVGRLEERLRIFQHQESMPQVSATEPISDRKASLPIIDELKQQSQTHTIA